MWYTEIANLW